MTWRNILAITVFGVGAALSTVWAYRGVRDVLTLIYSSSGIFGSSSDALALLEYVVPAFMTFWLSARIRDRGRTGRLLRQVYLAVTLVLLSVFALFVSQLFFQWSIFNHGPWGWPIMVVAPLVAGALWLPSQAFFAVGFVGLLIRGRAPA